MARTSIEWCDAVWNPVRGCSRVSEGCRHCYAERMASRFTEGAFHRFAKRGKWTGRVELIPSKLDEPLRWRKPRRVFVTSMSDLFHEKLSDDARDAVFAVMALAQQHTFQSLTKRPDNQRRYLSDPETPKRVARSLSFRFTYLSKSLSTIDGVRVVDFDTARVARVPELAWPLRNLWLGVSVEDQPTADERIPLLLGTPAATRFVSFEPAIGSVDFDDHRDWLTPSKAAGQALDLVIVGGESGPGARPFDVAWARSTIRQCREAGVAAFCKQLGARPFDGVVPVPVPLQTVTHEAWIGSGKDGKPQFDLPIVRPALVGGDGRDAEPAKHWLRLKSAKGGDPAEWPEDLRVREWPHAGLEVID